MDRKACDQVNPSALCTTLGISNIMTPALDLNNLAAMPKPTQLLLAHSLEQNNPDLTLLDDDTDVCKLLSLDWLVTVPCTTIGIKCFTIKPHVWRKLRWLRLEFLNKDLLSELKSYRNRKSTLYPWVW